MGKDQQLLDAVQVGNLAKVEKLLGVKKKKSSTNLLENGSSNENGAASSYSSVIIEKIMCLNVNVNCMDEDGSSPLIIAALHGHKEIVYLLLVYSANINASDHKGNTALHMAAWKNKSDIIDLLILNGAEVNAKNQEGNTPLHFACQYCLSGKIFTVTKLLQGNALSMAENNSRDSPLDLAARYDKRDVVSMLVDSAPEVLQLAHPLIEACIAGRTEVAEIFLEAGMDPNRLDDRTGSYPLQEAIRYFRINIVQLLLEFGAHSELANRKEETGKSVALSLPKSKQGAYLELIEDSKRWKQRTPKAQQQSVSLQKTVEPQTQVSVKYPLLRNKSAWLKNDRDHCSLNTPAHPCTNLIDGNLSTYWRVPGAYNWIVFDFGTDYILNGIRIYGCSNKEMLRHFKVEIGDTLSGPWSVVGKYNCDPLGSEDLMDPPVHQDFKGFYGRSRYWKLTLCSNFGEPQTTFHGLQFYGIEAEVLEWFKDLEAMQYCKDLVENGFNQLSDLARLTEQDIQQVIKLPGHKKKIMISIRNLREKCFSLTKLIWVTPPVNSIAAGSPLPAFSIAGDPFCQERVKLVVHGQAQITGESVLHLVVNESGKASRARFKDIKLSPPGKYCLEVQSENNPKIFVRASEVITVLPAPKRGSELDQAFADIESLLAM